MKKSFVCLILFTCLINGALWGQKKTEEKIFPFGIIETIASKELKENRVLNIYFPQGYHPDSSATYPVVYLLDGSAHEDYPHIAGLAQFLNMYGLMPPSIIVGIANVNRYRDFTTPTTVAEEKEKLPTAGGSEKFIRFLENEVKPFIEKRYKANGTSTIIGQSLGGLLASEILLYHPHLFNQYIIISPSMWWNNSVMLKDATNALNKNKPTGKKVYIAVGNEPEDMLTGSKQLADVLKQYGGENNKVVHEHLPRETHATILHRSVYQAMEWLYPLKE